jgi:hypothetical protein
VVRGAAAVAVDATLLAAEAVEVVCDSFDFLDCTIESEESADVVDAEGSVSLRFFLFCSCREASSAIFSCSSSEQSMIDYNTMSE